MQTIQNNNLIYNKPQVVNKMPPVQTPAINEDSHFKNLFQKKNNSNVNNTARFMEKLEAILAPNLPAKELISLIVRSALEIEYGRSFTLSPAFDKIVEKISNSVMVNPVLRRQALSVVSMFVESKIELGKKN